MSLRRSVAANFAASGWMALMSLAFVPLYVRYLGIESYALIGFFATLQVWLSLLDMGFSATLNREMARFSIDPQSLQQIHDLLRSMEIICFGLACLLALLVAGAAPLIATHWLNAQALPSDTVAMAIGTMGVVIAAQWLGNFYRSGLLGLQRQLWLSGTMVLTSTLRAAGSVALLAFVSPTIGAFFLFQFAVSAAETLLAGWHLRRCLPHPPAKPRFSMPALRRVWRFAAGLSVGALLATLLTQLDKILLAKLLPLDQFGYFMLMITVAGALSVFTMPIHNVAYPRFAEVVASGDETAMTSEYHKFAQLLAVSVLPAGLMLSFFSTEIIFLWTGDRGTTQAVAPILSVWVVGTVLNALMLVPYMAQLAHGWTKLSVAANTVAVVIMVPSLLLLVPRHGALAAAWIWVSLNGAYVVLTIPLMHSRILQREKWKWYSQDVLVPLAAGSAAAFALKSLFAGHLGVLPLGHLISGGLLVMLVVGLFTELGRNATVSVVRQMARRWADG